MFRTACIPGLLVLAAAALSTTNAGAQSFDVGLRVGWAQSNEFTHFVLCNARGCGPSSSWPGFRRNAPTAALVVGVNGSNWLGARAEVALAQKGYGPGDERSDWRVASQYLEFPLLVQARLLRTALLDVQVRSGLAPAVLVSCRVAGTTISGFATGDCGEPLPATQSSYGPDVPYDLGWVIGWGIRFAGTFGDPVVEVSHTRGLIDIREESGHTANRSTSISVGLLWKLR